MTDSKKTWITVVVALIVVASVAGIYFVAQDNGQITLSVFNWDFYIGDETVSEFERASGVKVAYSIYKDNDELITKLKFNPRAYDIAFPSDYMIKIMIDGGLLEQLDTTMIPNRENVGSEYLGNYYDPQNKYTVPYMFGTTGFAVNTDYIAESVLVDSISWEFLSQPRFRNRVGVIDDIRFTLGSALIELGYSPNTLNRAEVNEAAALIRRVRPRVFSADTPKDRIVSGELWVAYAWSGDVLQAQASNPRVRYVIPKKGSLRFQDGICIPKGAPQKSAAHRFINFLLEPNVSAHITDDILYGNTNRAALPLIKREIRANPASFPDSVTFARCQWIRDIGDSLELYRVAWEGLKE